MNTGRNLCSSVVSYSVMHRFFVDPTQLTTTTVTLSADQARQISSVLRMKAGEKIMVLDNQGWLYEVVLTSVQRKQAAGKIVGKTAVSTEPKTQLTLFQSILKRDKFELVLQKGTEVGVSRFVPVITERSQAQSVKDNKYDRWQRILTEAAEQSERGKVPKLETAVSFTNALQLAQTCDLALLAGAREKEGHLKPALLPLKQNPSPTIALFIGPEGGFSSAELDLAFANNITPITLGSRILRTETAAIVAASLIIYETEMRDAPVSNLQSPHDY